MLRIIFSIHQCCRRRLFYVSCWDTGSHLVIRSRLCLCILSWIVTITHVTWLNRKNFFLVKKESTDLFVSMAPTNKHFTGPLETGDYETNTADNLAWTITLAIMMNSRIRCELPTLITAMVIYVVPVPMMCQWYYYYLKRSPTLS